MGRLRFAFIMDPIQDVLIDKDTTFVFMLEAQRRGHELAYIEMGDLFIERTRPMARTRRIELRREEGRHFTFLGQTVEPLGGFDAVFMRKDPPFDIAYLHATQLLDLAQDEGAVVLNHPGGLRAANEKLFALNFSAVIPPTLVSQDAERLKAFLEELGGEMIIKPVDGHGGAGIFYVQRQDRNLNSILETATRQGREPIIAQQYLPAVRQGDKRLIVLNGEPLGCTLRVPRADEHRGNIHVGGTCIKAAITPRDREICALIGPRLRREGLYFVGLDIIGEHLTEVNVTSPTGVQEIDRLDQVCLEAKVMDFAEQKVGERQQQA
ncbi:MAG: glutathione synthase [Desulfurellaceae bacterium]|nr:glutathione synthase [Desulfurellaceae bacterium]